MITLELFVIAIIVIIQLYFFVQNFVRIKKVKLFFPKNVNILSVKNINSFNDNVSKPLTQKELFDIIIEGEPVIYTESPDTQFVVELNEEDSLLLNSIDNSVGSHSIKVSELVDYIKNEKIVVATSYLNKTNDNFTFHQIIHTAGISGELKEVIENTNQYLKKNKGATADFNLLRDITERSINSLENLVQSSIANPLYIGLVGTFSGIIIGLSAILFVDEGNELISNDSISDFLGGVLVAVAGSAIGLLLTLIGNIQYRDASAAANSLKNNYYTWLQTRLLPTLQTDVSNSLTNLKTVLDSFNSNFFDKLADFQNLFSDLSTYISLQESFITKLEEIGFQKMAKANIEVFTKAQESAQQFQQFVRLQKKLNDYLYQGGESAMKIAEVVEKLQVVENLHRHMEQNEDIIKRQLSFLNVHDEKIKNISNAIVQRYDESIDEIARVVQERVRILKSEEQNAGSELFKYFEDLRKVSPYEEIAQGIEGAYSKINEDINQVSTDVSAAMNEILQRFNATGERESILYNQLDKLVNKINDSTESLLEMEDNVSSQKILVQQMSEISSALKIIAHKKPWWQTMGSSVRKLFR